MNPRAILVAGFAVFAIYAYPGIMSVDAAAELAGARSGDFAAGVEPASVPALWSVIDNAIVGPFGMMAAGALMFLVGAYLVARKCQLPALASAWLASLLLLIPPVVAGMGVPGGYSLFSGACLLGLGLVLGDRPRLRAVGCVLFALAASVRFGGYIGTLPLVFAMPIAPTIERWRQRGRALGLWVATIAVGLALNHVVETRDRASLAQSDIAGTLAKTERLEPTALRDSLVPAGLVEYFPQVVAFNSYDPAKHGAGAELFVDPTTTEQTTALQNARRSLATSHAGAYLRHRLSVFGTILFGWPDPTTRADQPVEALHSLEISTRHSTLQAVAESIVEALRFAMSPWLYIVLAIALLIRLRGDFELRVLLTSGLAVEFSQLYFAADGDYQRSQYLIATALLALGIAIARGLKRTPDPA